MTMAINLADYEKKAAKAVKAFWGNRDAAQKKQLASGKADAGTRGAVTAGKNMDGFVSLLIDIIKSNGLKNAEIIRDGRVQLTLPGYFRPTKMWDMLVVCRGRLIAATESKSQVGSFGNNFNNAPKKPSAQPTICGRRIVKVRLENPHAPSSAGSCSLRTRPARAPL